MANLEPERLQLLEFFERIPNTQLVIPVYQRNYIWQEKKEVRKYLEDFQSILNNRRDKHFIGIMMYVNIDVGVGYRELSIVDGQQRLITTFLILHSLKELANESGDKNSADKINDLYLINKYAKEESRKLRLKPMVSDDDVYRHIIEEKIIELTSCEKKTNVYKNYKYIKDFLKKKYGKYSIDELLDALNKFYLVVIPLSDGDNAQEIFETINSAGSALSKADLIRNYLLMNIQSYDQEKLYKDYWKPLEDLFKGTSKMESYFRMFLANRTKNLCNIEDLYDAFRCWFISYKNDSHSTEDALKLIKKYAKYYCDGFVYQESSLPGDLGKAMNEFKKNTIEPTAPLLMEIYDLNNSFNYNSNCYVDNVEFKKIIDLFNIYSVRRNLCNEKTGILTRIIPSLLKDLIEECNGNYKNIYRNLVTLLVDNNKGKASFMPEDEYLKTNLLTRNAYALRSTVKIVFEKIESENNSAPVDFSKLSIEHLMPQTPTAQWIKELNTSEDEYENHLHRIGNLTFATVHDNSVMKNNSFDFKKEVLANTNHIKMNVDLINKTSWTIKDIENRTEELINKICLLYPYISFGNNRVTERYDISLINEKCYVKAHIYEDKKVEVLAESYFSKDNTDGISSLLNEEYLKENGTRYEFTRDYLFSSLQEATNLIIGNDFDNPWELWKDKDGKELSISVRVSLGK